MNSEVIHVTLVLHENRRERFEAILKEAGYRIYDVQTSSDLLGVNGVSIFRITTTPDKRKELYALSRELDKQMEKVHAERERRHWEDEVNRL